MIGPQDSGKGTVLQKLRLGREPEQKVTEDGFCITRSEHHSRSSSTIVQATDLNADKEGFWLLWQDLYQWCNAVIVVVSCCDDNGLQMVHDYLPQLLSEDHPNIVPLLLLANKQDVAGALPVREVACRLGLHSMQGRHWSIQGMRASTGTGVFEVMDWFAAASERAGSEEEAPMCASKSDTSSSHMHHSHTGERARRMSDSLVSATRWLLRKTGSQRSSDNEGEQEDHHCWDTESPSSSGSDQGAMEPPGGEAADNQGIHVLGAATAVCRASGSLAAAPVLV